MTVRSLPIVGRVAMAMIVASAAASTIGCGTPASDFEPRAFNGVASGGRIYCQFEHLDESYSGDGSDSYRAVGIDTTKDVMVVYFYNG